MKNMNSKDLTVGEKKYLKGLGVTEGGFDKMPEQDKREWKEEAQDQYYKANFDKNEANGRTRLLQIPKPNMEMQAIWDLKEKLINKILKKSSEFSKNSLSFRTPEELSKICQELT